MPLTNPHRVSSGGIGYDVGLKGNALLAVVTACCATGFFLVGYDNGVMGGVIGTPYFVDYFNNPDANMTGNIVSLYEIGCLVGALSTFVIGSVLGRRLSIIVGTLWMIVGAILQAAATSTGMLIAGRVITGVGMGIINATVPVLQAECSPAMSRGKLVAIDLVVLNCGIVLSYWIDYLFNFGGSLTGNVTWRAPLALQLVFIVVILILALILPDTPRWYASRGRKEETLSVLARLRNKPTTDVAVQAEFNDILQTIEHEAASQQKGFLSLIKPGEGWKDDSIRSRRRLGLACFIQAAQQLGGINALIYYSSTLFSVSLGFGSRDSALLAGGLNMVLILGAVISIFLVDRLGRRPLLLSCISGMSLVFVCQTVFVKRIAEGIASAAVGNAAVAMLFLFELFFSVGFQATVWMIPSEVLPLSIRTQGSALSTASNWICNFAVVKFTPSALQNITWRTYIIFAIMNAAWVPVIFFFLPETAQKSLEQVDELFSKDGWQLDHKPGQTGEKIAQQMESRRGSLEAGRAREESSDIDSKTDGVQYTTTNV